MIYTAESKICVRGGTASAVANNVAVNVSKHQKPPHGFAVVDRQTVHVVQASDTENAADTGRATDDQPQRRVDVKADVTQVRNDDDVGEEGGDRGQGGRGISERTVVGRDESGAGVAEKRKSRYDVALACPRG